MARNIQLVNDARSTLLGNITDSASSLVVASGEGALFPSLTGSQYFRATLENAAGVREIIKVTARTTDTFTIDRGEEGTTPVEWVTGDLVELRLTEQNFEDFVDQKLFADRADLATSPGTPTSGNSVLYTKAVGASSGRFMKDDAGLISNTDRGFENISSGNKTLFVEDASFISVTPTAAMDLTLPGDVADVRAGWEVTVTSIASGFPITVKASLGATVSTITHSGTFTFKAIIDTPTTNAHWKVIGQDLGVALGWLTGFVPTIDSGDTDHDISISTGLYIEPTDGNTYQTSVVLVKKIDVLFAQGTDAGGMATGSVVVDTTYHLNLISQDTDGDLDFCYDVSETGANTPSGWTFVKRIHSLVTDDPATIIDFDAYEIVGGGLRVIARLSQVSNSTSSTSQLTQVLSEVPIGVRLYVRTSIRFDTSTNSWQISGGDETLAATTASNRNYEITVTASPVSDILDILVDTSAQVNFRKSGASGNIVLASLGWLDFRID